MSNPVAVLISDIHFTVPTLELASQALIQALGYARKLKVPLIVAGDTLDGKALMQGKCVNALLDIFNEHQYVPTYIMRGNHDALHEKSYDHSLRFLDNMCQVVSQPFLLDGKLYLIPYEHDKEVLTRALGTMPAGSTLIMHQGVQTADMGHYVQDKSSLPKETFKNFRVISGHYHKAQDIQCGESQPGMVGVFSYIGNPYSLTFGEAKDGPKGFRVLNDDGTLDSVQTNLRKHVVIEGVVVQDAKNPEQSNLIFGYIPYIGIHDLIWVKLSGIRSRLSGLSKKDLGQELFGHENFKLDKIYTDVPIEAGAIKASDAPEVLDKLIDRLVDTPDRKTVLKQTWRSLL